MTRYRVDLPQLSGDLFLTDGGLETTLIFHEGFELPDFAAFHLLTQERGRAALGEYFRRYVDIGRKHGVGLVLESPTWRASSDWGDRLGYSEAALADANRESIRLLEDIRKEGEISGTRVVISGTVGPRGDGYDAGTRMTGEDAERYHAPQIGTFSETGADLVSALTMTHVEEAIGVARAARSAGVPVVISFTVETDGRLPSGQPLGSAIEAIDEATDCAPAYFMVNCAHPTHFGDALDSDEPWIRRLCGIRANASTRSHAELDEAPDLDDGDPIELGLQYRELRNRMSHLGVLGGCCGTDHRHVEEIARACLRG